ncbi:MAG: DNA primase, partial [Muribaculaceae bacterium]|nr:DNA primase [Muribaculaceae bacterium]
MLAESTIKQVHDRADIVDVVTRHGVSLKRMGASFKACCPFHGERTPSFTVYPARNNYHCYGCGRHGDAIAFVMELENKSYLQAIETIANYYGVQVLHQERQLTDDEKKERQLRESMLAAVSSAQDFFVEQFFSDSPEAEKARKYAYARWGEEYCKETGIGYAPDDWSLMVAWCQKNCVDEHALTEAGVLRRSEKNGKLYPLFRGRITIPIKDRYGRVIGFTARYIGNEPDKPKYINSSDSAIFKKGDTVFGLHTAVRTASKSGRFVVVEGAPDVLKLQSDEVGISETVAALGTAWTENQFRQLQRYASSIVFIPDADPPKDGQLFGAGVSAVMKNGLTALKMGFDVTVREIPTGDVKSDPDSYITSIEKFNDLKDVHFAVWYGLKKLQSVNTETDKVNVLNEICKDVLALITDETLLSLCLEPLAKAFGRLKLWKDALRRAKGQLTREAEERKRRDLSADDAAMRSLGFFVKNGCYCSYDGDELVRWSNFTMKPLFHIIDGDNAIRIFRLMNERGTVKEIELRQEELISLSRFQQRVESLGFFNFKGDNMKLQNLKEYLYSITDSALQLSKMGWNSNEEVYAFGDGIFADNILYPVNDLGIVKVDDRTFYLPAFSKMHIDQRDVFQFERSFSCKEHGEVNLYDYIQRMITVFGDNAKVGFAFVLATLFLDIVKKSSKRLALLNIFGRKGTGKTELGTALMSFFIRQNDPPSLATTSLASLNDMLSCAENNLVHLDEYKNELDFRKIEILKQIWGGVGQTKKNMDGDKKVQRTFVRSGVILTGQDAPTRDDALFSRVIHLTYSETTFSNEAKRNFDEFQAISARGVSHLTVQLLKLRKVFEADYAHHYNVCKRELISALDDDKIEDRVLNNWLAPLAAFHTVQTSLDLPYTYTDLFNICVKG